MEIKRILWPTDLSGNAEKAKAFVEFFSQKYQTEVYILYVIEELAVHEPWYGVFDESHVKEIHEWEAKKANQRLDQICDEYLEGCPFYTKAVATGDPAEEILKFINENKIDMVIITSRGRGARFSFGSVSEKVVKNSPVPVILVPVTN